MDDVKELMDACIMKTSWRYTCERGPRPSGALLYADDGTIIEGVVQPAKGSPSCKEAGCVIENGHCVRNNHAEVDAIISAARAGISTRNAYIFSINKPCFACMRAIIAAGITRVYYAYTVYDEERTNIMAERAGLEVIHVDVSEG